MGMKRNISLLPSIIGSMVGGGIKRKKCILMKTSCAHVTIKTAAYSEVFGFFRKKDFLTKSALPRPNHFLKIKWEILFFLLKGCV